MGESSWSSEALCLYLRYMVIVEIFAGDEEGCEICFKTSKNLALVSSSPGEWQESVHGVLSIVLVS